MGARGPTADETRIERMSAMFKDGRTYEEVAQVFGVSRQRIQQILSKHRKITCADGGMIVRSQRRAEVKRAKKDAACLREWGCTFGQLLELRQLGRSGKHRDRTPTGAFSRQRQNARNREIPWQLSLWQWWMIWQESGHWEERGRGNGYCMCRYGDSGPYAVGNVFIATNAVNIHTSKIKKSGLPLGVRRSNNNQANPYTAVRGINGKSTYLGSFKTPELAHAAYLAAAPTHEQRAA